MNNNSPFNSLAEAQSSFLAPLVNALSDAIIDVIDWVSFKLAR